MAIKKCNFCKAKVPERGQCSQCGFVDGLKRQPTDDEYKLAREINEKHSYPQYKNIDMLLID